MRRVLYILVLSIGLLQIAGYISGITTIRGLGMASCSSPLPIVFTEVKGVETFASDFFIRYTDKEGVTKQLQITPELYSKLKGPYNRRNIYGAAISYGPILKKELWLSVLNYGICNRILLEEMGLPLTAEEANNCEIFIKTRTAEKNDSWALKPECKN